MPNDLKQQIRSWAPVPLRLALGAGFAFHGFPKVFSAPGHASFAGMLADLGVPAAGLNAYLIGGFELVGGVLLLLGFGVRAVSAIGVVEMVVAAALVHWPAGFNFLNVTGMTDAGAMQFGMPGWEVNLLYVAGFASLIMSGAGRLSLQALSPEVPEREIAPEREVTYAG